LPFRGQRVRHGNARDLPSPAGAGGGNDVVPDLSVSKERLDRRVVRGVERLADSTVSQRLHGEFKLGLGAAGDRDMCACFESGLGGRKPDARASAHDQYVLTM
jgi:hypothetical protein